MSTKSNDNNRPKSFEKFIANFEVDRLAAKSEREKRIKKQQQIWRIIKNLKWIISTVIGIISIVVGIWTLS